MNTPDDLDQLARRRAHAKMGWYLHACVYLLVNLLLYARFALESGSALHYGPLLGWGLGLALHGISVFFLGRGSAWSERMVQRERELLQRQRQDKR